MRTKWNSLAMVVLTLIIASSPLSVMAASPENAQPAVVIVSGNITCPVPDFDTLCSYNLNSLYIRVEGTEISAQVNTSGQFSLSPVPTNTNITLVVEEPQGLDVFTAQSKRVTVTVPPAGLPDVHMTMAWKWHFTPLPPLYTERIEYLASYFTSPNNGWMLANFYDATHATLLDRRLYSTTDGANWSLIYQWYDPNFPGIAMDFVDATHNWIGGDPAMNKGGISVAVTESSRLWRPLPDAYDLGANRKNTFVTHIAAMDANHLVVAGYEVKQDDTRTADVLWQSDNNGTDWEIEQADLPVVTALGTAPNGQAVAALNDGAACKAAFRNPSDGSWTIPVASMAWCINNSQRIPYSQGSFFASADGGAPGLYTSTDGGESWSRLTSQNVGPVSFITSSMGWAVSGSALKSLKVTYDGGHTWQVQANATNLPDSVISGEKMDIFAVDANTVYWRTANANQPLLTFSEPNLVDLEVLKLPQRSAAAPNSALAAEQFNFPVMSLQLVNHGAQAATNFQLVLHRSGNGTAGLITGVTAYWDKNRNGVYDPDDTILDNEPFPVVGASLTLTLNPLTVSGRQTEIVGIAWNTLADFPYVDGAAYGLSLKPASDASYDSSGVTGKKATAPAALEIKTELDNLLVEFSESFNSLSRWDNIGGSWVANGDNGYVSPSSSAYLGGYEGNNSNRSLTLLNSVFLPPSNKVRLLFWNRYELFDYGENNRTWAHIDISLNGSTWTHLQDLGGTDLILQSSWFEQVYDLAAYAGKHVYLRFIFEQVIPGSPELFPRFWNLDDVRIVYDSSSVHFFYLPLVRKMP